MVGIVQEQHPLRARLFMQWKRMDWPILIDPLNLLDVGVVPITLLIDEHGIIRGRAGQGGKQKQVEAFLGERFEPEAADRPAIAPPDLARPGKPVGEGDALDWRRYAEALTLWGGAERLDRAVAAFERAVELDPEDPRAEFRLGVAYRMRYDSGGEAADFRRAVEHWSRAREIDPNNYIWTRRLQQFGPRQQKPYPFYDWVATARAEIESRGDRAVALPVEPSGAELAHPAGDFEASGDSEAEPDPEGRIRRDPGRFVRLEATSVPIVVPPSSSARIHVELAPEAERDAHWNNEVGGLVVWIDPPAGWKIDRNRMEVAPPPEPVSGERRRVEFDVLSPDNPATGARLTGYALYYVCEGIKGQCLYRRQDLSVPLRTR